MNAAVVRSKEERRYAEAPLPNKSAPEAPAKTFSPLEAYVLFCVVILFLFVMAMPRRPERSSNRRPRATSTRNDD